MSLLNRLKPAAFLLFLTPAAFLAWNFWGVTHDRPEALGANPHYRYCRALGKLGAARVHVLRCNAYAAFVGQCQRRGQRLGDVKASPLSRHTGWADVFARAGCGPAWNSSAAPVHSAAPDAR